MKISVDNWRWAGVPFYLRTGKNMAMRASEIVITFKNRPHDIFARSADAASEDPPNRLIIRCSRKRAALAADFQSTGAGRDAPVRLS